MMDLNELVPDDYADHLFTANDINNRGEITGLAVKAGTEDQVAFWALPGLQKALVAQISPSLGPPTQCGSQSRSANCRQGPVPEAQVSRPVVRSQVHDAPLTSPQC